MTSRLTGLAAAFGCLVSLATPAGAAGDNISPPAFTPVQAELFNMPGSLANAWGDFDGDGDVDLAVSLKTGEIRLYRNKGGAFASVSIKQTLPSRPKTSPKFLLFRHFCVSIRVIEIHPSASVFWPENNFCCPKTTF